MLTLLCAILLSSSVFADSFSSAVNAPTVPNLGALEPKANYGTDTFTGAFYYTFGIAVPKGTNDLTPTVELLYNSQSLQGQPSVVGSGWLLTENYVQRDVNGTATNTSDDKFFLTLNGRRYELIYNASQNQWHTKIESYLEIINQTSNVTGRQYFRVRTTDGTTYAFGDSSESELVSNLYSFTVRWYLNQVTDVYYNRLTYYYDKNPHAGDAGAVYPNTIEYNKDNRRRVEFSYQPRTDIRTSYKNGNKESYTYRLSSIAVKVNTTGTWTDVRHYDLLYANYDGVGVLSSVLQYGNDTSNPLPATTFEYYNNSGWTSQNDAWNLSTAYAFQNATGQDTGTRLIDLNGDGLVDLIQRSNTASAVLFNNGGGWNNSTSTWNLSTDYAFTVNGVDNNVHFVDLNGDGRIDIIKRQDCASATCVGALLNNGSGWTVSTAWNLSQNFAFLNATNYSNGVEFADLNGDGLTDVIKRQNCTGTTCDAVVLNTGSGWVNSSGVWNLPITFAFVSKGIDQGVRLVDLNGDGLIDAIKQQNCTGANCSGVLLNNGSGWTNTTLWTLPIDYALTDGGNDTGVRLIDLNGDGLADVIKRRNCNATACSGVLLNNGSGWANSTGIWNITADMAFVNSTTNKAVRLTDINGDGVADVIKRESCTNTNCSGNWRNNAFRNYLLWKLHYPFGGTVTIDYAPSSLPEFDNTGGDGIYDLPVNIPVVRSLQTLNGFSDNRSVAGWNQYTYKGGSYKFDRTSSEFRGFAESREITPGNNNIVHRYHQSDALQGREYATEQFNGSTVLLRNTSRIYATTAANGVNIITLTGVKVDEYDGMASPRTSAINYTYDQYGNTLSISNYGDVSTTGDESFQTNTHSYDTTNYIVNPVTSTVLRDKDNSTTLRQTNYTNNDKGDPVNISQYLSGTMILSTITYDSFGNVIARKDPRAYTTNYTYDTTGTYVATETNPLAQVTTYDYDLGTGNLRSRSDPNGFTTTYQYDKYSRPSATIQPYDSTGAPTITYTYGLDGSAPENITISKKIDAGKSVTTTYFFDGREKLIQAKTSAEGGQYATQDYQYDAEYQLNKTGNPAFTSSGSYSDLNTTNYFTTYQYDGLDRVTKITKPDNTYISIVYNKDLTTRYDENNHRKDYTNDPNGNILTVVEYNGSQQYTTRYSYDGTNQLLLINDSSGNTIRFAYDTLGRKTSMIDPDMGTWNYTYDVNNNLLTQRDNRGANTTLTYDAINRVFTKNTTDQTSTYTYDTVTKGTLARQVANDANISYTYDQRLRVTQENLTTNGQTYPTAYTYDSADNIASKTFPDGRVLTYTYNVQGLLDTIPGYVTNIDYNALGNPIARAYNNTLTTNLEYYSNTLRLKTITTGSIQAMTYTYDGAGNIIGISDTVEGTNETFTYDDLHRLQTATKINTNGTTIYAYNYSIDALNRIRQIVGLLETLTFTYGATPVHAPSGINTTGGTPALSVTITTGNVNATQNTLFNITAHTCCSGADCGSINVSLDPEHTDYNYYSKRTCIDNECTTTFYSSPHYGYEGTTWKPLEQLHSFKGNVPIDCVVKSDGKHLVECVDYNATHRKLRITTNDATIAGKPFPIRILKPTITEPVAKPKINVDTATLDASAISDITATDNTTNTTIEGTPGNDLLVPFDTTSVETVALSDLPVVTYVEDPDARQEIALDNVNDVREEWVAANLHDEIHVGESSTNVTLVPNNATSFNGWWKATTGTLALYNWTGCDANAYSTGDKNAISDGSTGTSIYGSGGGSGTDYSYCHRMQWQIPYNASSITALSTWAYWTGSLSGGADSITKALYIGNTTGQKWVLLQNDTAAWGAVNHTGSVSSSIADFVESSGGNNYIYTLLHYNASKAGSTYAYSNFYDTALTITTTTGGGGGSNGSTKGLVSTTVGATPFYTTSNNPRTINLSVGQCTDTTWTVNATGNTTTYTFFAYANQTNNMSNSATSPTVNITITSGTASFPQLIANYTFTSSNEGFNLGSDWSWDSTNGWLRYTGSAWGGNLYSPNLSLSTFNAYNITIVFTSGNITYTKLAYASYGTSINGDKYHFERVTDMTQHFKHDGDSYSSTDDYNDGTQQTIRISANFTSNTTKACRAGGTCAGSESVGSFTRGDYIAITPGVMSSNSLNITAIEVWRTG